MAEGARTTPPAAGTTTALPGRPRTPRTRRTAAFHGRAAMPAAACAASRLWPAAQRCVHFCRIAAQSFLPSFFFFFFSSCLVVSPPPVVVPVAAAVAAPPWLSWVCVAAAAAVAAVVPVCCAALVVTFFASRMAAWLCQLGSESYLRLPAGVLRPQAVERRECEGILGLGEGRG